MQFRTSVLVSLGLVACGGGDAAPPASAERLVLVPASDATDPGVVRVVEEHYVGDERGRWSVRGSEPRQIEPAGTEEEHRALLLPDSGELRVLVLEGDVGREPFDHLSVEVSISKPMSVVAKLIRKDEVVAHAGAYQTGSRTPSRVSLRFPTDVLRRGPYDRLELAFEGEGSLIVRSVRLEHWPLEDRFAAPEDGETLLAQGTDARRGVLVTDRRPVEASFPLAGRSWLAFSCAVPADLWFPNEVPTQLDLVLTGSGGEPRRETVVLPGAGGGWQSVRLSLDDLTGESVHVRFGVAASDGRPFAAQLADVRVLPPPPADSPRTVVLVTSDTHRYDHVATSTDAVELTTPALDALATRGVTFDDCFSTTNSTCPSHVAILTGTHPRDTGVLNNHTRVLDSAATLAEAFRVAGFRTWAVVSAVHLGDEQSGLGQGFDRMCVPPTDALERWRATDAVDTARRWLPDAEGEPVFLWLHLFDAHTPYEPPAEWDRAYYPKDRDPYDPGLPDPGFPGDLPFFEGVRDPGFPVAQYRAEVSYLDRELGRLFAESRFDEAIIAVTSDHGESLGQHGIYYGHQGLYPDTVHVPMILAYPGAPAGARVEIPVDHLGLGRTLLDLGGLAGSEFPGASWLPYLVAPERPAETESARFALSAHAQVASITANDQHLVLYLEDHRSPAMVDPFEFHRVELFDLGVDPDCQRDLVDERPEVAAGLHARLVAWLLDRSPTGWSEESAWDARMAQEMAALGYVEGGSTEDALIDPDCPCEFCVRMRAGS